MAPEDDPIRDSTAPQNRHHGHAPKTVRGERGELPLDTPRDRLTFEPQLIAKPQRRLAGFDAKILALDAKGLTRRDLQDIVQELSSGAVSPTRISAITADLDAAVTPGRQRRLAAVWPLVSRDGLGVPVRGDHGRVPEHPMDGAIGGNLQGNPTIVKPWRWKGADLIGLFAFPAAIRKAIDTTKVIESMNSVIRKDTRNRKQSPHGESALKLVSRAIPEASPKGTRPIVGWKGAWNPFAIRFAERRPGAGKSRQQSLVQRLLIQKNLQAHVLGRADGGPPLAVVGMGFPPGRG